MVDVYRSIACSEHSPIAKTPRNSSAAPKAGAIAVRPSAWEVANSYAEEYMPSAPCYEETRAVNTGQFESMA